MDDPDFPVIYTGNGIDRDFAATTNDRLKKSVLEMRSLINAVSSLENTIVNLNGKNEKLQSRIFWLTIVGVILAATQVIPVINIIRHW